MATISQLVLDKAVAHLRASPNAFGFLLTCSGAEDGVVCAIACARPLAEGGSLGGGSWGKDAAELCSMLPGGVQVGGLYCGDAMAGELQKGLIALRTHTPGTALVGAVVSFDPEPAAKLAVLATGAATLPSPSSSPPSDEDPISERLLVRLTAQVTVTAGDAWAAAGRLEQAGAGLCVLADGAVRRLVDPLRDADIPCGELLPPTGPAEAAPGAGKKGGKKGAGKGGGKSTDGAAEGGADGGGGVEVLQLRQVWSLSCDAPTAPTVAFLPGSKSGPASSPVSVDVLAVCLASEPLSAAVARLRAAALRQATALAALLKTSPACRPTALHFQVAPHLPFPLSLVLPVPPSKQGEEDPLGPEEGALRGVRESVHARLFLPMDRPYVRVAQAMDFAGPPVGGRLRNVHEGLAPSGVKGGSVHLVQGAYDYCHYMQDKFDDDGWGCMYRSYQTVISWFRHQHYTALPIQSHEGVQKMLVSMGDKPPRFVGSKQWIGAMEAAILLDQYLGVSCKVINVPSGHDLEDKGRELAQHFDTQGTPISIGGGVLAFTILGVHYNAETSQIKFLVLDPHYTGSEDLGTIQNQSKKNTCSGIPSVGWHDVSIFRKDSFYNLALPQRPKAI